MSTKKKSSKAVAPPKKGTPMEEFLGPNLLTEGTTEKPTKEILKGKDLVLIYFSAAWCPPCKGFTPILIDFYNNQAKDGNFEIVYVSSDKEMEEFKEYFAKMPWVAQCVDTESAQKKNEIAQALKIQSIPVLIVLDPKTGNYITDQARTDVAEAGSDVEKQKEIVAKWKSIEPVPLEEAELTGGGGPMTLSGFFYTLLKNPMFVFGIFYGIKKLIRMYQAKQALENGEGDGGAGGEL